MSGRSGKYNKEKQIYENIVYLPVTAENDFKPELPSQKVDMIYLCFPNNPTGTVLTKEDLKKWVDYAKENKSIILYDVRIGNNVIVGAGSVVTKDLPDNSVCAGIPCKKIGEFEDFCHERKKL